MAKENPNHFRRDFDSMAEFMNWLKATPPVWTDHKSSIDNSFGFTQTETYEDAERLALYGWPEGRDKMDRAVREAARAVQMQSPPSQWLDVAGSYPCVPFAIAGDPHCMVNIGDTQRAQRPVIRFLINLTASGMVNANTMTTRGAAILSWVDALEAEGFRCEVVGTIYSQGGGYSARADVTLKRAEEALDVDRLAYSLVHPSMLRRQGFAFIERTTKGHEGAMGSGYGAPTDATNEPQQIYFGMMHGSESQWRSPETAAAFVKAQIENGGIRLHTEEDAAA